MANAAAGALVAVLSAGTGFDVAGIAGVFGELTDELRTIAYFRAAGAAQRRIADRF